MLIRHFPIWKQAPFLRLVIPFVFGITCNWYLKPSLLLQLSVAALAAFIYGCLSFLAGFVRFKWNWISGLAIFFFIVAMGSLSMQRQDVRNHLLWMGNKKWYSDSVGHKIISQPVKKGSYYLLIANAIATKFGYPAPEGRVQIRIQEDSLKSPPETGDILLIKKQPTLIPGNSNPGAFNFQFYCLQQGITHQVYLSTRDYELIAAGSSNSLSRLINSIQHWVLEVLKKYIPGRQEAGVAEALLIGYREDLDKSLLQSYANTGVVHIIAISGLHLGMLYGLLLLSLRPLKSKIPKWVELSFVLSVLWMFSLVAGASPSVLRSAVMFSFIAYGKAMKRKAGIYNTLSASAFFLLWINPFYLWDPGFQLSYAAVMSIAIFQKPIALWVVTNNKILDACWKAVSVSLAAQILTTPISLYLFHQQPVLFLFANAIAIPLSGFILYAEILLLLIAGFPAWAANLGEAISFSVQLLNRIVARLDDSSISLINQISFSFAEMVCAYFLLASLAFWLLFPRKKHFYALLFSFLLFAGCRSTLMITADRQQKVIIYQIPSHSVVDFISGSKYFELMDEGLKDLSMVRNFQIEPAHSQFRVLRADSLPGLSIHYPFIFFKDKTCLLINKQFDAEKIRNEPKIDLLILHGNPGVKLGEIRQVVDCGLIVWDGSNAPAKTNEWKSECDALALRCHSTPIQGPVILDF